MVADLYKMPEAQKKDPPKQDTNKQSGFSGLFSRKK